MSRGNKPDCTDCGKELSAHHCKRCKSCDDKAKKGKNHWNWKEDRNSLAKRQERGYSAYRNWRLEVNKRDNYKCRIDNCDCSGKIIAHHILSWSHYPELRYNINNGITLCHAHHPLQRAEEKRLIPFLQGLVPVLNEIS